MKSKYLVALVLVLMGTNLFTFATTRYWATEYLLGRADDRMTAVFQKQGALEIREDQYSRFRKDMMMAVGMAGGNYNWWNEATFYWAGGVVLTISGLLFLTLEPRKQNTA